MEILLWGVLPYVTILVLVGGLIWRYRFDQFGWTTRSSQVYESKLLRIASPLFHYALIAVIFGHIAGLFIPKAFTEWIGVDEHTYHNLALYGGGLAGVALIVGLVLLIWRRRSNRAVFRATTWNDKIMYVILAVAIGAGMFAKLDAAVNETGVEHSYRETVSVWFRSLFVFQPDIDAMTAAPWPFHVHVLLGMLLIAAIPLTRLVHAFTAPFHYLFRPYIVYRSRGSRPRASHTTPGRGWEPVEGSRQTPHRGAGRR